MAESQRVRVEKAQAAEAVRIRLRAAGYGLTAAELTSQNLVQAEADGCWSHGLRLIPDYLDDIENGIVIPDSSLEIIADEGRILVFNGNGAPGHWVLATALDAAIDRAESHGIAAVWVSQVPHVGRLSAHTARATRRGATAILSVSSALDEASALVAPPGSSKRVLGSNPLAIGIAHAGGENVSYDASTSSMSFYNLLLHHDDDRLLSEDLVVDADGLPSRDPASFFLGGAIRPSGGGRGFGLSLTLALLCQLRCPAASRGRANAFAVVIGSTGSLGKSLAETIERLRAEGAYIPGSKEPRCSESDLLTARVSTIEMLKERGVTLDKR